jgi:cobalamin biosynthesis protein CobT
MSKSNDVRDAPIYKQFIEQANSVGAVAAARLGRVLASEAKKGWHDRLTSGHPDPRRLHMLASGTGIQVMRKPHDVEASDTAALLLIDQSGSMGGPKIHNAALAAYVFARVIEKAGHASAVCGFGYGGDYNKYLQLYKSAKVRGPGGRAVLELAAPASRSSSGGSTRSDRPSGSSCRPASTHPAARPCMPPPSRPTAIS